jgi:hypothetical protein
MPVLPMLRGLPGECLIVWPFKRSVTLFTAITTQNGNPVPVTFASIRYVPGEAITWQLVTLLTVPAALAGIAWIARPTAAKLASRANSTPRGKETNLRIARNALPFG